MLRARAIPCLLLRNGRLVKTIRFDKPRYVGDPVNAVLEGEFRGIFPDQVLTFVERLSSQYRDACGERLVVT